MDTLNIRARLTLDDFEAGIEANVSLSVPLGAVSSLVKFDQFGITDHIYIDPLGNELLISFTLRNEAALAEQIQPAQ